MRFAAMCLFVAACGGADSTSTAPEPARAAAIELSSNQLTLSALRATQSLRATVRDQRGAPLPQASLTWNAGNADVAVVDASGVVTAVGNGNTTVTVRSGTISETATVTVAQVAASLRLSATSARLTSLGDSTRIIATPVDAGGHPVAGASIVWSSIDSAVAMVTPSGSIRAVGNGSATVNARAGSLAQSVPVTVAQVATTLSASSSALVFPSLGEASTITVVSRDAGGATLREQSVQWTSSDTSVARVVAGRITAVGNGTATVVARVDGASTSIAVRVAQVPASITINGSASRTVVISDTAQLSAVVYDANRQIIRNAAVAWTSSDTAVASVNGAGIVTGRRVGSATVSARAGAVVATAPVALVIANWRVESIPTALATPAPGALWEIPVVIIRYIPTFDGVNVDRTEAGIAGTVSSLVRRVEVLESRVKFMLEEGSRFRGYRNPLAAYALGYRVVHIVTVFAHFQRGKEVPWSRGHYFPDYQQILAQVNAESWVNDRGVKEFWVWGYHSENFEQPESNMSSPVTGDISNSSRFADDLPVYRHTYTVYGYNYARTQAEAVHNHGHQLEALLGHIDRGIFWKEFVGRDSADTKFITGRAGWTHMPPNTTRDYDYLNTTVVQSDIASWLPGGGDRAPVSVSTWASIPYAWPTALAPGETAIAQQAESQWYLYWMQNMPGRGNTIPFFSGQMTNWWQFTGDWDAAIRGKVGLATVPNGLPIEIRNDYVGGILLNPGGGLVPGQSVTLYSPVTLTVAVYNCGKPNAGACIMDPYPLTPGKKYRVITHPNGPAANLTIVER